MKYSNSIIQDSTNPAMQMIADCRGDITNLLEQNDEGNYPLIVTRNIVLFPTIVIPIVVGRPTSIVLLKYLEKHPDAVIGLFSQRDEKLDTPKSIDDLYTTGVFARVMKVMDVPSPFGAGNVTAIFQAVGRCTISAVNSKKPFWRGHLVPSPEVLPEESDAEFERIMQLLDKTTRQYVETNSNLPNEQLAALSNISNKVMRVNHIATNMPFPVKDKVALLETDSITERAFQLIKVENREIEFLRIENNIREKTQFDLDEQQKEYFLHQQMKNIREELGGDQANPDLASLRHQAQGKKWSKAVEDVFNRECDRLVQINVQNPDYSMLLNYLQTLVGLPWGEESTDDLDLKRARRILDHDHYGMEKVKERILEYIAVLRLRGDLKSPILCLYGPPGVGKTSLGKSIAEALRRKYVRMSLGGLHDESEIRGHRRTYIGAMPGRILKNIQKAGTSNPVFILDEIDKVTQNTHNGDPASALLEVLDPEQNNAFHDNFLDLDYDLSNVMFVATANDLSTIPQPLLDRMEIIHVSGYITEEKVQIAKRHLVPRELANTGLDTLDSPKIKISKAALEAIIEKYTRESGVRQLEKQINKAFRKLAYQYAVDGELSERTIVPARLEDLLGKPPFYRDIYQGNAYAGVVTGLAWTSVGGEILFIETSLSKGRPGKLTITGNLGDVMKESAVIALEYVKAHIDSLGVDYRVFDYWNIHIHVPEGATPKDGPSAGITIATSIASALTQRKVRANVAMTGEITLRGKVLPVGGIKEKILAAKRAGITDIMLCQDNRKDIDEIDEEYRRGVTFHYVENVNDVWDFALTDELVSNPVKLEVPQNEGDKTGVS